MSKKIQELEKRIARLENLLIETGLIEPRAPYFGESKSPHLVTVWQHYPQRLLNMIDYSADKVRALLAHLGLQAKWIEGYHIDAHYEIEQVETEKD